MMQDGSAAFKGADYIQALTAQAVLDLCQDRRGGELVVEQAPGRVDLERTDRSGVTICVLRALSGPAPHTVLSGDVWDALRRWCGQGREGAVHVLQTDGTLYASAATAVADRLARFAQGAESDEDRLVVQAAGIDPASGVLRRVRVQAGSAAAEAALGEVGRRVERLVGGSQRRAPAATATERLLAWCSPLTWGESRRTISAESALALVGAGADSPVIGDGIPSLDPAGHAARR